MNDIRSSVSPECSDAAPELTESARAVLRALARAGPITRPALSFMLAFSKPTMSMAVAELGAFGLVASRGLSKGPTGRTAVLYGLGPSAGYVVGVDAGTTHVRAIAVSLDGQRLAQGEQQLDRTARNNAGDVSIALRSVTKGLMQAVSARGGRLRAAAVALPAIVSQAQPTFSRGSAAGCQLKALRPQFDAPLIVENNVNCAAVAELHHGAAAGRQSFAYLQVGVKIGLGIVHEKRLFRGLNGAAGEVGRLPFPWSADETPRCEALEHYLGSEQLMVRLKTGWPKGGGWVPETPEELFALAARGSAPALAAVERHADDIGRLVSACVGVLDPGLVVLGGGVGQNAMVVERVRRVVSDLTWPTEIALTQLGPWATVQGAAQLAAEYSLARLLGEDSHPAVVLPRAAAA